MLDQKKHRLHLLNLLLGLYKNSQVGSRIGFKGGTAAYFFYDLPRFSVDLDFDLLRKTTPTERKIICQKITQLVEKDYVIKDEFEKRQTLFWLLSYARGEVNIKIEISKRLTQARFEQNSFYGVGIPVMVRADMVASKLMALLERKKFANRDLFDAWYFLSRPDFFEINYELIQARLGLDQRELWLRVEDKIKTKAKGNILQGVGELLTQKQKAWAKKSLVAETLELVEVRKTIDCR